MGYDTFVRLPPRVEKAIPPIRKRKEPKVKPILRIIFRGKLTILAVVAALTLAMAGAGVASHDKAKIGRNLHQGVNNLANGITSLTGSLTTPILQLRNDGAGPALSLGTPPDHFNRPVQTANGDAWQAEIGGPGPLVVGAYAICADVN